MNDEYFFCILSSVYCILYSGFLCFSLFLTCKMCMILTNNLDEATRAIAVMRVFWVINGFMKENICVGFIHHWK
jgi:hypothetical protein